MRINRMLLIIIIILNLFLFYKLDNYKQEDLNHDGVVNSADLLYLRKYLLEMEKK